LTGCLLISVAAQGIQGKSINSSFMKHIILIISLLFLLPYGQYAQQAPREGAGGTYYGAGNRLFSGIIKEYYPDGTLKMEMPVRKGALHGNVILYFSNSIVNEIRAYRSGKMHGTWSTWNEDGTKSAEANYLRGRKEGKWYIWDGNGVLRYDMTYRRGEKTGTWYMYDESGNLIMEQVYK
jgi:antitoxin component YwqK of YwqJK toxin-antitoxin module